MMWLGAEGTPVLYIYLQDRVSECGDIFHPTASFEFQKGHRYRIDLYVKMNSGVGSADGRAMLYIDGDPIVVVRRLNLSGNNQVKIDKFNFHSFHGGEDPSWSPSKNTYIYFDNFTVMPGKFVTAERGTTCEILARAFTTCTLPPAAPSPAVPVGGLRVGACLAASTTAVRAA